MSELLDSHQPLLAHLVELRTRLVRSALVFLVGFAASFFFSSQLYDFLVAPLAQAAPGGKLITIGVVSPFFLQLKIAALAGFLLTLPHTLYQAWAFVAPGLYANEKRLVLPLVVSSSILFFIGMSFAYFFVFGVVFSFMAKTVPASMQWLPDSAEYFDFALSMFVAFGLTFETPVVVVLLVRMGVVTLKKLVEIRSYVIVGAFVVAAVVTPPDILSQLLLAIPLCLLYEVGLLAARWVQPVEKPEEVSA
ncbi:sec-independent protein translocase protein TatC [Formivibrio citricus]|uniref:Sec-independent protein translocase protein TatC n=1 Tax=Formivibrio citricus TaxID=83765 RepID=A0A1I5C5T1_9NEIS|nr:twin-arginine translocase subunit TatC [Formivibrio citricus]SFN82430.1 sec-independent protein translocase protein TatC [Formivibrio citricus]